MASVEYTSVLQDAGLPKEIADNIVDTKEYLEKVEETKRAIRDLRGIYNAYKNLGSSWCLNVFWDLEPSVDVLVSNTEFINETWFKEHWKLLFKDLLFEIRINFDEYVRSRTHSVNGLDDFAISQIRNIRTKLIDPLANMKKTTEGLTRRSWRM